MGWQLEHISLSFLILFSFILYFVLRMHNDIIVGEETYSADAEKGLVLASKEPCPRNTTPLSHSQTTALELQPTYRSHIQQLSFIQKLLQWATQTTNSSRIDTSPPPDGGVRIWLIVFFAHMTGFNTFGFLNAYGVLQTYYVSRFNLPPSTV